MRRLQVTPLPKIVDTVPTLGQIQMCGCRLVASVSACIADPSQHSGPAPAGSMVEFGSTGGDSPAWSHWAMRVLAAAGVTGRVIPVQHAAELWSTLWVLDTGRGRYWLKETSGREGDVQRAVAAMAPRYVDAPVAVESRHEWMITHDGGPTMLTADPPSGVDGDVEAWTALVRDYAQLQRSLAGYESALRQAGLPTVDPRSAANEASAYAQIMCDLPATDPRHLDPKKRNTVLAALPDLAAAGHALAAGPVPMALDHGDLSPRNVFRPLTDAAPYRFFDFGDARWAHPFTSLAMLMWDLVRRWNVEMPSDTVDLRDQRIRVVLDTYLSCWSDLATMATLRQLARHAIKLAPLHRCGVWLRLLTRADRAALAKHGRTPWAWLQDVAKPVLL